jgi:hypothetical protein
MLTHPAPHPDRFLLGLLCGVTVGLIAIALIAPLADTLARRDLINAQLACRQAGGEIVLCGDGTWRCETAEGR